MTSEVRPAMFHLSLTVVLSFNIKYSSSIVNFISNEKFAFRAAFAFG